MDMSTEHISLCLKMYDKIIGKIAWSSRAGVRPRFVHCFLSLLHQGQQRGDPYLLQ